MVANKDEVMSFLTARRDCLMASSQWNILICKQFVTWCKQII